jgi:hypothetical protein
VKQDDASILEEVAAVAGRGGTRAAESLMIISTTILR